MIFRASFDSQTWRFWQKNVQHVIEKSSFSLANILNYLFCQILYEAGKCLRKLLSLAMTHY